MAKKQNKYSYVFVIQGNYGYGWDDLTEEETYKEAREQLKCYNENEPNVFHRKIQRRVLNK